MTDQFSRTSRKLGLYSATATFLLMTFYVIVLALGLISLASPEEPIGEPYFTLMELLIVVMVAPMVMMMVALSASAPENQKPLAAVSVVFMAMVASTTSMVHFTILILSRHASFPDMPLFLEFRWPSVVYVLDVLAWDIFFSISVFFASALFRGNDIARWIRYLLILSGVLAFSGLGGVVTGDMQIRNIGIVGYAVVFPIAALLIALFFYRMPGDQTG